QFVLLRLPGLLCGTATCGVVWWLARRLFDARVALVAGLLAALYRTAVYFDAELLETGVATFLHVGALALVVRAGEATATRRSALLAGLALGVGAVARPTLLAFAPFALVALGRRHIAPLLVGIGLGLAPTALHNAIRGHDLVLVSSNLGLNFYMGNNPEADGRSARATDLPPNPVAAERAADTLARAASGGVLRPSQVSDF